MNSDMTKVNINTEVLEEAKESIKVEKEKLKTLLEVINQNTEELKLCWETSASESVFSNFEEFYKNFKINIEDLEKDITFLENTVEEYKTFENQTGKNIDEKIAI